jgi:hypothetical protein
MFHKRGLLRNRVVSDEGFAVRYGFSTLTYSEQARDMQISINRWKRDIDVDVDTVSRWDADPAHCISNEERRRITDNIKRALESQGFAVYLVNW